MVGYICRCASRLSGQLVKCIPRIIYIEINICLYFFHFFFSVICFLHHGGRYGWLHSDGRGVRQMCFSAQWTTCEVHPSDNTHPVCSWSGDIHQFIVDVLAPVPSTEVAFLRYGGGCGNCHRGHEAT